jgi:hypothetical protein
LHSASALFVYHVFYVFSFVLYNLMMSPT